jgi:hypothetical protein
MGNVFKRSFGLFREDFFLKRFIRSLMLSYYKVPEREIFSIIEYNIIYFSIEI